MALYSSSSHTISFVSFGTLLLVALNLIISWTELLAAQLSSDQRVVLAVLEHPNHDNNSNNNSLLTIEQGSNNHIYQQPQPHKQQQQQPQHLRQSHSSEFEGRENGIDPIYLQLLKRAQKNSQTRLQVSPKKQPYEGIVIGPTEGKWERHTFRALQNARRIRNVLAMTNSTNVKVALMTSQEHVDLLQSCNQVPQEDEEGTVANKSSGSSKHWILHMKQLGIAMEAYSTFREACRLWDHGKLFDDIVVTQLGDLQPNDNHTNLSQGTSSYWLKALGGYRNAPYKTSLFVDTDAYPCPGVEKLFAVTFFPQKYWQLNVKRPADLAIGLEQFPNDGGQEDWNPGRGQGPDNTDMLWQEYSEFTCRNTGVVLFHFARPLTLLFTEFLPLVAEHVYNNVAAKVNQTVTNDQTPFRIALFVFRRLYPLFTEQNFPMHASCRSYPGKRHAGTDGFVNGMFPLMPNGKHCDECYCTPCLVAHNVSFGGFFLNVQSPSDGFACMAMTLTNDDCFVYFFGPYGQQSHFHYVKINGFMGWEEDFVPPPQTRLE